MALGNHLSVTLRNARRADLIREHAQDQLRRSLHDDLTGLPNRRYLEEHFAGPLASGAPATIILLDLDRFNDINDTLGHHTGDALAPDGGRPAGAHAPPAMQSWPGSAGDEYAVGLLGVRRA